MIWDTCPAAVLRDAAFAMAANLAKQPTRGLGMIKRALNASVANDLDAQLAVLPSRTWFEIWRLDRPAGAPPVEPAATCTNCGAPGNGLTSCRYCGTQLCQVPSDFAVGSIEWLA